MKKRKKLTLALVTVVVVSMLMGAGVAVATGARWKGTGQVSGQLDYSNKIEDILAAQKQEISNLLKTPDGTISKEDHDEALKTVSDQLDSLKLETDKQLQAKDVIINDLNVTVADLNAQLEQAYKDAVMVNNRLEEIYNKYK